MANFNCDIFCDRVNLLFGDMGQMELAEKIGISQGVISAIKNKKVKAPGADTIFRIANHFNVSADYLLGLSEASTQDVKLKAVCEYTGLSQKAIEILSAKDHLYIKPTLSKVLESEEFWFVIYSFTNAIINKDFLNPNADYVIDSLQTKIKEDKIPEIYRKSLSLIGQKGLASVYKQEVTEYIWDLFDKVVKNEKS